jgi:hypothetical protein
MGILGVWMSMSMCVHVQWPTKSLESKWGVVKHNEYKFGDVYNVIMTWTPQVQAPQKIIHLCASIVGYY